MSGPDLALHVDFIGEQTTVEPGEELTFDYGTTDTVGLEIECKCGAPTCRGVVTSDDWKDPAFRARS